MADWQLSAADLSEALWPAALLVSALLSAWVLHDARRRAKSYALPFAFACALLTLALPPVIFPLYLAWRLYTRHTDGTASGSERVTLAGDEPDDVKHTRSLPLAVLTRLAPRNLKAVALPLAYAAVLVAVVGFFFVRDYRSFDARLARARRAKHYGRPERAIEEYRAALRLREDAHTRKLLGMELWAVGRREEALVELRAAALGGEPLEGEGAR